MKAPRPGAAAILIAAAIGLPIAWHCLGRQAGAPTPRPDTRPATRDPLGRAESTVRMAERLATSAWADDRALLEQIHGPALGWEEPWVAGLPVRARGLWEQASVAFGAGRTQEALDLFLDLDGLVTRAGPAADRKLRAYEHYQIALCWLRLGEQENCLAMGSPEACFFPIRPGGLHTRLHGARRATETLTDFLLEAGDSAQLANMSLMARWLLNLAYAVLGEYPDGVPSQWLIHFDALDSPFRMGTFRNVAAERGLGDAVNTDTSGSCVVDDFNGDGWLDILVCRWNRSQLRYFQNDGNGNFTDRSDLAGIRGLVGGLNMVQADYDNDGRLDVYVTRGGWHREWGLQPDSLLRNAGPGQDGVPSFDDITEEAGLLAFHPSQVAAWADYDNDGWIDLFVGNETRQESPEQHPSKLFRNRGDGRFDDATAEAGVETTAFVKGAVWGDIDNDGRQDLFISVANGRNRLLRNEGPGRNGAWRFRDAASPVLPAGAGGPRGNQPPGFSFPCWFWDFDNDGWLDLLVFQFEGNLIQIALEYAGIRTGQGQPLVYRNAGTGSSFIQSAWDVGLDRNIMAMGCNFGDLDNDGWLDFYAGTGNVSYDCLIPNLMFRSNQGRRFEDVTSAGGFGHLQKGHGIGWGDLDNDGDQDILAVQGGMWTGDVAPLLLFENPGSDNHWLTLRAEGRGAGGSNRSAIGVRIRVTVEDEGGARRDIHAVVSSGGSFGANSLQQEIGLGRAARIASLEVWWPATGQRQVFEDLAMDRAWRVREGEDALIPEGP